ncbi:MAG: hypothetical protein K2Z25_19115 [Beijerinckiaceae bacterium]|nr:hypothetical protein [Beijerinckiaceae bacterium]
MFSNLGGIHQFTSLEGLSGLVMAASASLLKRPRYAIAPTVHGPVLIVVADGRVRHIVVGRHESELQAYRRRHAPSSARAGSASEFWDVGVEVLIALDETAVPPTLDQEAVGPWVGDTVLRQFRDEPPGPGARTGDTYH